MWALEVGGAVDGGPHVGLKPVGSAEPQSPTLLRLLCIWANLTSTNQVVCLPLTPVPSGANPLLPLLLPEGAEQYAAPPADATAADAYAGADWAAEAGLPVDRMSRYRVRLGLPGVRAAPDPATTPHFGQRAGYYLQQRSSNGSWKDLYFFRLDEFLAQDFALVGWGRRAGRGFVSLKAAFPAGRGPLSQDSAPSE